MPMHALEAGIPKLCGTLSVDGRRRRRAGDAHHRHRAQGSDRRGRQRDRRRDGEGRGDAVAGDGDDARGAHHRRRGRPRGAAAVARARGERDLRLPERRRVPIHQRHRDRAGQRSGRRGRRDCAHRCAHRACAARSPSRWRATPRARPSSCASTWSAPAPRAEAAGRGPRGCQQPARAVLAQRRRRLLGPGALGARRERRVHRSRAASTSPTTASRCAATASRARTTKPLLATPHGRARDRDALRPARSRTARQQCSPPTSRTPTSTRTGARRERSHEPSYETSARRGEKAHRPGRGAAVHPGVLGQDRRDQVRRPRDGRSRSSPTSSPPMSCSCASSG